MVAIQQIQGRKSQLFSYSYKKAIPVEAETVEVNQLSTAAKAEDRTGLAPERFKIYGSNQVGVYCRNTGVKSVKVTIRRKGSPAPLCAKLVDAKTNTVKETVQVSGVDTVFKTVTVTFSQQYSSSTLPNGTHAGFYVLFHQLGNAGDSDNCYEILPNIARRTMDYVYSSDAGATINWRGSTFTHVPLSSTDGRAARLNGSDYGQIAHAAGLAFTSFTLEIEFRLDWTGNAPQDMFLADKGYDSAKDWWIRVASGTRTVYVGYGDGSNRVEASFTLSSNDTDWHFLQATYDNSARKLDVYLDGVLKNSVTGSGNISNGTSNISIGAKVNGSSGFTGLLGLFRAYSAVLSQTDLAQSLQQRQNPPTASLKTWVEPDVRSNGSTLVFMGYKTVGASTHSMATGTNNLVFCRFTAPTTASYTVLKVYLYRGGTGANIRAGVYEDKDGYPYTKIRDASLSVGGGTDWVSVTITSTTLYAGRTYWLALNIYNGSNAASTYYDAGSANQYYYTTGSYGGASPTLPSPAPSGMTGYARVMSIYVESSQYMQNWTDLSNNNNFLATVSGVTYVNSLAPEIRLYNASGTELSSRDGLKIYSTRMLKIFFTPPTAMILSSIGVMLGLVGKIPCNLQANVRKTEDNTLVGTLYIDLSKVADEAVYAGFLTTPASLTANTSYYVELSLVTNLGDEDNFVYFKYSPAAPTDFYQTYWLAAKTIIYVAGKIEETFISQTSVGSNQTVYGNTRVGQTILVSKRLNLSSIQLYVSKTGSPQNLILDIYAVDPNTLKPTGPALATLETPAASIGTSLAWVSFNISYMLLKDTYYAVVVYQKGNGGDASNYYTVQYTNTNPIQGNMVTSSDAGATWTVSSSNDLGIKILNYKETAVWSKTVDLTAYSSSIAATTFTLKVKYRSLYGQYVVLRPEINGVEHGDTGCGYNGVLSISDIVIPPSKTHVNTQLNIVIYGSGDGLLVEITYARCFYFNAQRITPADFGVSEMILWDGALEPGTVVIFNDNPLQFIMNPDDSPDVLFFDTSEPPREVLVRSLTIVRGRADVSFLGW